MTARSKILLDPVDFMALQLSAEAFGGIGAGQMTEPGKGECPLCVHGHAGFLEGNLASTDLYYDKPALNQRLDAAGLGFMDNDVIVPGTDARRIPFLEYVKLGNIDIKEVA